jgi:uncharacterized repeat protein (TIGR03833 family)
MNRPRNRQPRPERQQNPRGGRTARTPATQAQAFGTVPTVRQVVPGAGVSIVLKEDQPTGDETRGVVQDVLTKGNHPRGIKVRLTDGQVGRVQRMVAVSQESSGAGQGTMPANIRFTHRYTDVRNDEYPEGPPPRSLADFFPEELPSSNTMRTEEPTTGERETVKCPFCEEFEGDEMAVSYHIDREHLT